MLGARLLLRDLRCAGAGLNEGILSCLLYCFGGCVGCDGVYGRNDCYVW